MCFSWSVYQRVPHLVNSSPCVSNKLTLINSALARLGQPRWLSGMLIGHAFQSAVKVHFILLLLRHCESVHERKNCVLQIWFWQRRTLRLDETSITSRLRREVLSNITVPSCTISLAAHSYRNVFQLTLICAVEGIWLSLRVPWPQRSSLISWTNASGC